MKKALMTLLAIALLLSLTACAHEHSFGEWSTDKEAGCTEDGMRSRACPCGETETEIIPATGHTDGEWQTDIEPSCALSGSRHLECAVCGETIGEEEIPATLEHDYICETVTEASCVEDGMNSYTCSVCADTYSETFTLPEFSPTELYENYLDSVGEICTFDRSGDELALGSCFVYSEDGTIITNYHVIEDAYSAWVTFGDDEYRVKSVLAYDEDIDIAVLKISAQGLTAVPICTETHKVGEAVYAFGSSKGLTSTFSEGIITHASRDIGSVNYIQHDAPISSGNSGGPLINRFGRVIGINTWTLKESQNLNFAINISELDRLSYDDPLTMAEFYNAQGDAFTKLKNYIMDNGRRSDDHYLIILGEVSGKHEFTRAAYYYPDKDIVTMDVVINGGECWLYIELDSSLDGSYPWKYFDEHDSNMSGILYSEDYDEDTLLGYNKNNISHSTLRTEVRELASNMVNYLCCYIDDDLEEIGVTAEDLGFSHY